MQPETKQDLVDVIRLSKINDYHLALKEEFGSLDNLIKLSQTWPRYEGINARYYLDVFPELEGFSSQLLSYMEDDVLYPSRFSDIEYAPKKMKNCLERGNLLLKSKTDPTLKFLLETSDDKYDGTYEISITTPLEKREIAEQFLRKFREYVLSHNIFKGHKIAGNLGFIELDHKYSWDDLLVDDLTMKALKRNLVTVLENRQRYADFGVTSKRGLILSGEPGSGKTTVGKILCHTMPEWSFLWVGPGDLGRISDLKKFCEVAKAIAPTILFLEDLDMHFQSRDTNAFNSMLGELMNQLDGIEDVSDIVIVGTTNRPGELEAALAKRPGRFDQVIKFEKPDASVRRRMLERFSQGKLKPDVDWEKVLLNTDGLTGAQLKEVLNQGFLRILDQADFKPKEPILLGTMDLLEGAKICRGKDFSIPVGFANRAQPDEGCPAFD